MQTLLALWNKEKRKPGIDLPAGIEREPGANNLPGARAFPNPLCLFRANSACWIEMAAQLNFPARIYQMLESESEEIIQWNTNGLSFRIIDHVRFENELLQKYFKRKLQ
jgi:hypothetical protein